MYMPYSPLRETEPQTEQFTETQRDVAAVAGIVHIARAVGVKSEEQFDDVVFEVMNFIYAAQTEYEPGEEVVRCAREQLARTTGLLACEKSVRVESSAPLSRFHRHGTIPC